MRRWRLSSGWCSVTTGSITSISCSIPTGLYKERHNIRDAVLQTAAPVGEEFVERLCRVAEARTHSEVHIRREVHPELVGGFVFRIDDVLIDASLAAQLKLLRRKLGSKPQRIV